MIPIAQALKDAVCKYARVMRRRPFSMKTAADALETWVNGTLQRLPLYDVSNCAVIPAGSHSVPPLPAVPILSTGAMALENEVADVCIKKPMGASSKKAMTPESDFVYGMAKHLVSEQGYAWGGAISIGKKCWDRLSPNYRLYLDGVSRPPPVVTELTRTIEGDVAEGDNDDASEAVLVMPARGVLT